MINPEVTNQAIYEEDTEAVESAQSYIARRNGIFIEKQLPLSQIARFNEILFDHTLSSPNNSFARITTYRGFIQLVSNGITKEGVEQFIPFAYPSVIRAGKVLLMHPDHMPKSSQNVVGLSSMHDLKIGENETKHALAFTAVLSQLDLQGDNVIEIGSGYGTQIMVALKKEAKLILGLDIQPHEHPTWGDDLIFNGGESALNRVKYLPETDINKVSSGGLEDLFIKQFRYERPTVLMSNMGVHYDVFKGKNGNEDSKTGLKIATLASSIESVKTVILGAFDNQLLFNGETSTTHMHRQSEVLQHMDNHFRSNELYQLDDGKFVMVYRK